MACLSGSGPAAGGARAGPVHQRGGDPIGWRSLGNRKRGGPLWGRGGDPVVGSMLEALVVRLGLGALALAIRRGRQRQPIEQSG